MSDLRLAGCGAMYKRQGHRLRSSLARRSAINIRPRPEDAAFEVKRPEGNIGYARSHSENSPILVG